MTLLDKAKAKAEQVAHDLGHEGSFEWEDTTNEYVSSAWITDRVFADVALKYPGGCRPPYVLWNLRLRVNGRDYNIGCGRVTEGGGKVTKET